MEDLIYGLGVIPNMPLLATADISRALLNKRKIVITIDAALCCYPANSLAIISACFKTNSVASSCMSGG